MRRSSTPRTISPADKLFRLRPNLCLWGPPPPYAGRGRPACHGPAFKLREPLTWGRPASKLELIDPQLGRVQVLRLARLHFRLAAKQPLVVVRIERLDAAHTARDPGVLWLGWHGRRTTTAGDLVERYLRRFAVDHWHRFAKQDLHWTLPHLATPEQAQCWSDLMPLLTWQLWLARHCVNDVRLPWQKPQAAGAQDAGPGPPGHGGTFGGDWHTGPARPNPAEKRQAGLPAACVSVVSATKWSKRPAKKPKSRHLSGCASVVKERQHQLGPAESIVR